MTEAEKPKEDLETKNVRKYGRVFRLCVQEALVIADEFKWTHTGSQRIFETAKALFDRYWNTQNAVISSGGGVGPPPPPPFPETGGR